jgi:hypothetical protein
MLGYSSQHAVANVNPLCVHSVGSCAVQCSKERKSVLSSIMLGYSSQHAVANVNPLCLHFVRSFAVFEGKKARAEHEV